MMKKFSESLCNFSFSRYWHGDGDQWRGNKFTTVSVLLGFLCAAGNTTWLFDKNVQIGLEDKIYAALQFILMPLFGGMSGRAFDYLASLSNVINYKAISGGIFLGLAYAGSNVAWMLDPNADIGPEDIAYAAEQFAVDPIVAAMACQALTQLVEVYERQLAYRPLAID